MWRFVFVVCTFILVNEEGTEARSGRNNFLGNFPMTFQIKQLYRECANITKGTGNDTTAADDLSIKLDSLKSKIEESLKVVARPRVSGAAERIKEITRELDDHALVRNTSAKIQLLATRNDAHLKDLATLDNSLNAANKRLDEAVKVLESKPKVQSIKGCDLLYKRGLKINGIYTVNPDGAGEPFEVLCDVEDGGWTVFLRRYNGETNFLRTWDNYKRGFGSLKGEFWLGNDKLHWLTGRGKHQLKVDVTDFFNHHYSDTLYSEFSVGDEESGYPLHLSGFSGSIPSDEMSIYDDEEFSTIDRPDAAGREHVTKMLSGWWHSPSSQGANPTGLYGNLTDESCMSWRPGQPLRKIVIKTRPVGTVEKRATPPPPKL